MDTLDWNMIRAFSATAETGSLSGAARALGLTQPTLSRQVAALEASLGVMLFDRVGKKLVLTAAGEGLLGYARTMAASADDMSLAAAGRAEDISGRVTISASDAMAAYLMPGIVARLQREVPQVTISIVSTNALSDLRRREADIALRHLRPTEPELIGRLVCEYPAHFYASDDWIAQKGMPANLADIVRHGLIAFEPVDRFLAHMQAEGVPVAEDDLRIMSENSVVVWEMIKAGLGIGLMLEPIAAATPGVVRLLPEDFAIAAPLWLVTHRELRTARRIRLVYDIIAKELTALARNGMRSAHLNPSIETQPTADHGHR
jgi:DNA-binding transcriptional LysR family regulator